MIAKPSGGGACPPPGIGRASAERVGGHLPDLILRYNYNKITAKPAHALHPPGQRYFF
ncbi:MAG: hypothetical protein LBF55_01975 [Prevotellaceae bacterium]|nr:hypothetical protein [Prevotellaceae bacterium]